MKKMTFKQLQENVERIRTLHDQAVGSVKEILKQLWSEFTCTSLEDANKLLKSQQGKFDDLQKEYRQAIMNFNKDYEMNVIE